MIDQPAWWVDLASEFLTRYNDFRFYSRAKAILGDGKKTTQEVPKKPSIPKRR